MRLAFIGGCLNQQPGLSRTELYHHALRDLLNDSSIDISLGQYTSYNLLSETAIKLINAKLPDVLFLFLRPFPLMALNKLWIKYINKANQPARKLHPSLFNRKNMAWEPLLTNYPLDDATIEPRREKFGFRDLNLLSGLLTGLNNWAVSYLLNEIKIIEDACTTQHKKLVLISLPQNPESLIGNYTCKLTNKKLKPKLHSIPFIEISSLGNKYFEPDGIHYNIKGHKRLAEILCKYLRENIILGAQISPSI